MIPQKIIIMIGCIKIQEFTFTLKDTIPYNFLCKVNSPPINSARICINIRGSDPPGVKLPLAVWSGVLVALSNK